MQPDPCAGLWVILLFLLVGLKGLFGGSGLFRGFSEGFWTGFFNWLFVGSRRPAGTPWSPLGCLVIVTMMLAVLLSSILFLGIMASIRT